MGIIWALIIFILLIVLVASFLASSGRGLAIAQLAIIGQSFARRFPSMPSWSLIAVVGAIVFGSISGIILYSSKIAEHEDGLVRALMKADILSQILSQTPGVPAAPLAHPVGLEDTCGDSTKWPGVTSQVLTTWLERFDLAQQTLAPDELTDAEQQYAGLSKIFGVMEHKEGDYFPRLSYGLGCQSTLEMILSIARDIGNESGAGGKFDEHRILAELAAALARLPGYVDDGGSPLEFVRLGACLPTLTEKDVDAECKNIKTYQDKIGQLKAASNGTINDEYRLLNSVVSSLRDRVSFGLLFDRPKAQANDAILQALFARTNVYKKEEQVKTNPNRASLMQQLSLVIRFERALLGSIGQDSRVREEAYYLDFWVGLEQLAVLCLAFFLLALLFGRWIRDIPQLACKTVVVARLSEAPIANQRADAEYLREAKHIRNNIHAVFLTETGLLKWFTKTAGKGDDLVNCSAACRVRIWFSQRAGFEKGQLVNPSAALTPLFLLDRAMVEIEGFVNKDPSAPVLETWCQQASEKIEDSRWLFGWSLSALPAIGFLSTLWGILSALGGAGAVSAAKGRVEQAIAMDSISGSLSLAFSTTIIALTSLLALSLLDQWQANTERRLIEDMEQLLTEEFLPNEVVGTRPGRAKGGGWLRPTLGKS
jgi:hypothetical protein